MHTYTEVHDRLDLDLGYPSIVWSSSRMQKRIYLRILKSSVRFWIEDPVFRFVLVSKTKPSYLSYPSLNSYLLNFVLPFLWIKSCFSLPTCWIKITFFLICSCWELLGVVGSSNQNLHFRSREHPNDQGLSDGGMSGCLEQGFILILGVALPNKIWIKTTELSHSLPVSEEEVQWSPIRMYVWDIDAIDRRRSVQDHRRQLHDWIQHQKLTPHFP